jgi:hypothetical protein
MIRYSLAEWIALVRFGTVPLTVKILQSTLQQSTYQATECCCLLLLCKWKPTIAQQTNL